MNISFDQVKHNFLKDMCEQYFNAKISREIVIYSVLTSQRLRTILAKLQMKKTTTTDESIIAMEWSRSCLLLVMEFLLEVLRITLNVRPLKIERRTKGMMKLAVIR